eukprot:scaffold352611_cov39-Attheya_sp.AAC.1
MKISLAVFLGLSAVASYPTRVNGMCTVDGESANSDSIKFSEDGNDVICSVPEVEFGGCHTARIVGCRNVHCDGYEACRSAEVTGATTVRCTGRTACLRAEITATARVDCDGIAACSFADITIDATDADAVVTCTGQISCRNANVNAGPSGIIVCSGNSACDRFSSRTTTLTGA